MTAEFLRRKTVEIQEYDQDVLICTSIWIRCSYTVCVDVVDIQHVKPVHVFLDRFSDEYGEWLDGGLELDLAGEIRDELQRQLIVSVDNPRAERVIRRARSIEP